jgi:hypothetical protein
MNMLNTPRNCPAVSDDAAAGFGRFERRQGTALNDAARQIQD